MERIVEHLSKAYPLTSAAWTDWAAARQPAGLAGTWAMSGYIAGKGPVFGVVAITADPQAADSFVTESKYTIAGSGETAVRKGRGVVYAGFQWRGRSAEPGAEPWRETMFVERAQREITGRWFGGAYDEVGADVRLVRIGADPIVLGTSAPSLKTGSSSSTLRIYGANLPLRLRPEQVNLGQGVTVTKIVSTMADTITVAVEVAAGAVPGPRDLLVAGAHRPSALTVYDKVDSIRVTPQAGLARVGGAVFPKQVQQFEAVAFHNGPDGQPNTKDDWNLGLVSGVAWAMEEYAATFGDDDLKFVGALDASSGLFTPNLDGPNPDRTGERNNIGDVWVVASVAADPARGIAAPMRARGHLVVAPPVYVKWSATGVGQ
jgi:quinohemoprotein amine dehydrogenase